VGARAGATHGVPTSGPFLGAGVQLRAPFAKSWRRTTSKRNRKRIGHRRHARGGGGARRPQVVPNRQNRPI